MIYLHRESISEIFTEITHRMLWAPEECVDLVKSPTIYSYDNLVKTNSCEFSLNLSSIGLTKNRWARFLTQYIKKVELEEWLESIKEQRPGMVNLLRSTGDTEVAPDHYHPERMGHRWGVCFLGVAFQKTPQPKLTLYSRTARMPTTAAMELNLISQLAREIRERCPKIQEIKFVWFCSAIHITAWDIMPYLVFRGLIRGFISTKVPFARFVERQYKRTKTLKATREDIPYGRQRRITNRVQQIERGELLPDCWTSTLSVWGGHS